MAKKHIDPAFAAWRKEQDSDWQFMDSQTLCEGIPDFGWE